MAGFVQLTGRQVKDHSLEMADLPLAESTGEILISEDVNGDYVLVRKKHGDLGPSEGVHTVHAFQFSTIAERDAFVPVSSDVGKIGRIGEYFYLLSSTDPIKWVGIGAPAAELDAGTATTDYGVNPEIDGGNA